MQKSGDGAALDRVLRRIEDGVIVLSRWGERLAGLACLVLLGVICYTVVMRYVFSRPPIWNEEIAGWLVVGLVMLAVPEAQRRGENIGVDLVVDKFPSLRRVVYLFGFGTVGVTAYLFLDQGVAMIRFSHLLGLVSNTLPKVPLWMVQSLVPIGGALLLLVAIIQLALWLRRLPPRDFGDPDDASLRGHE